MKQALIYSLKVWLTGVAVALMITWIADSIAPYVFSDYIYSGVFGRIAEVLIFSLAYAVPFCIGVSILSAFDLTIRSVKLTLTFFTLIAGWLPVITLTNIIDEPISFGYTQEALVYIFLNCLAIWFYKPLLLSSKNMNFKFKGIKRIEGITTPSPTYS